MCTWVFSRDNACQPTGSPEDYAQEEEEGVEYGFCDEGLFEHEFEMKFV